MASMMPSELPRGPGRAALIHAIEIQRAYGASGRIFDRRALPGNQERRACMAVREHEARIFLVGD
ncbi:hypothetical protein [Marinovum algicola]|uniref:hypothetical protein n=1 Tax=Marinovum algicola TaxID=42444 RepID=UPI003B51F60D